MLTEAELFKPLVAGITVYLCIWIFSCHASRFGLVDIPDARKRHDSHVPLVGGVAIYVAMVLVILLDGIIFELLVPLTSITLLTTIGCLDDAVCLGIKTRFATQILAGTFIALGSDLWIRSVGIPIFGINLDIPLVGIPLTIFAVVGLTNAFNMVDGLDGLCAGHMLIGLGSIISTLYLVHGYVFQIDWILTLASMVVFFGIINLSLAPINKVFLGDAGSLMFGFLISWILIYYSQQPVALLHPVAALWCVAMPVFDSLIVIIRRLKERRSPFSSDRFHIHHLLIDAGISPRTALISILVVSVTITTMGIWVTYVFSPIIGLFGYLGILFVCGSLLYHPKMT